MPLTQIDADQKFDWKVIIWAVKFDMEHMETMNDSLEMQEHGVVGECFVFFPLYPPLPTKLYLLYCAIFPVIGGGGVTLYEQKAGWL